MFKSSKTSTISHLETKTVGINEWKRKYSSEWVVQSRGFSIKLGYYELPTIMFAFLSNLYINRAHEYTLRSLHQDSRYFSSTYRTNQRISPTYVIMRTELLFFRSRGQLVPSKGEESSPPFLKHDLSQTISCELIQQRYLFLLSWPHSFSSKLPCPLLTIRDVTRSQV